jgi:hypothetical protein
MPQLHVDDIIITIHDPSQDTHELQHDCKNDLVTMQSVGSDKIPLHRCDFACPHHFSAIPTGTTHSAHSYDEMCTIGTPMMDGISWKSAVTERHAIAQQMALNGLGIPQVAQAPTASWYIRPSSPTKRSMRKLDQISRETEA